MIRQAVDPAEPSLRLLWRGALVVATVFAGIALIAIIGDLRTPRGNDFISFWAAGKLALEGYPALAYDLVAHHQRELAAVPGFQGTNPFPYPPPFLFFVSPFAILPPAWAQLLWLVATGALFWLAVQPTVAPRFVLAFPPTVVDVIIGQSSLLTGGLLALGARLASTRPLLAGACLGALVIKPQLALFIPIALAAGGYWRAFAAAALSALLLLGAAFLVFGADSFRGFVDILPFYGQAMEAQRWPWVKFGSVFALLRQMGASSSLALAVHCLVALGGAFATWRAWRADNDAKIPILIASSLLVSPYLLTYDLAVLVVAIAWLAAQPRMALTVAVIWALTIVPMFSYFGISGLPATAGLGTVVTLIALVQAERAVSDPTAEEVVPRDGIEPPTP